MLSSLPKLGVGLGFREPFRGELFQNRREVDFLEITADHYLDATPEKMQELELLAAHFVLIPHAINLSLGSAEGLDQGYLRKLAALVRRLNPPWWSEHIAFTRAGGVNIGHLAPLPFTEEAVEVISRNVTEACEQIRVPLILENITYTVAMPGSEMTEAEFLTRVLDQSESGLLLDVTNLHTNAVNHGYNVSKFLNQIPLERVVQLHFAGGHWRDGVLVDSHAHPTPSEVWDLLQEVVSRVPAKGVVLERDENLPPFNEILGELGRARAIGRKYGRWA